MVVVSDAQRQVVMANQLQVAVTDAQQHVYILSPDVTLPARALHCVLPTLSPWHSSIQPAPNLYTEICYNHKKTKNTNPGSVIRSAGWHGGRKLHISLANAA